MGIDYSLIQRQIDDIAIKTILSAENSINQATQSYVPYQNNCFQIFGFDVLIDSDLKVWLIEVNLSPSMSCESPLDQKIKGNMIADSLTLCGVVPLEGRVVGDT